jgi:hypothetical protein
MSRLNVHCTLMRWVNKIVRDSNTSTSTQLKMANIDLETAGSWNRGQENIVPGHPLLANHMCLHPQIAIFRSFLRLNMLHLLHLQAEIVGLENKLQKAERDDHESADHLRSEFSGNWWMMENSAKLDDLEDGDPAYQQSHIHQRLQALLHKYSTWSTPTLQSVF